MADWSSKLNARPKRGETDDDLLQFQRDFLASNATSATKVISQRPTRQPPQQTTVRSDVGTATERDVVTMGDLAGGLAYAMASPSVTDKPPRFHRKKTRSHDDELDDPESFMDHYDTHITKVLSEIVERDVSDVPVQFPAVPSHRGFPVPTHRCLKNKLTDDLTQPVATKRSLFAQQFLPDPEPEEPITAPQKSVFTPLRDSVRGLKRTWHTEEAQRIDGENRSRLAAMSEEEILQEQANLLKTLDPTIIALLTKKKQRNLEAQVASALHQPNVTAPMEDGDTEAGGEEKMKTGELKEDGGTEAGDDEEKMKAGELMEDESASCQQPTPVKCETDSPADDMRGLPLKPTGEWVHMSDVEADKLEWMRDLPAPSSADTKTGLPARFDLRGNLVPADADLPTHLGLHHHGDEPQRAGYRLDELFQLARSANMQQRSLALTVLAHIICKARLGAFCECTSVALIPALVEGGVVFLLRWALDDSADGTVTAALHALHALLVSAKDEMAAGLLPWLQEAADRVFCWHRGAEKPSLSGVPDDDDDDVGDASETPTTTDAALVQRDVVKGLLKMQLLSRLRYLLEVWRPPPLCVLHCCELLIRVARHSTEAVYQLMRCPRLISMLCREFLPTTWKMCEGTSRPVPSVYGRPLPAVLKLIRVICTASRTMAASLIADHNIMTCIVRYIAEDAEEMELPISEAVSLQTEALRIWQVCLSYGLATAQYSDLYPIIINRVQRLCRPEFPAAHHTSATCSLISVLEAIVLVSGENGRPGSSVVVSPAVSWPRVSTLIGPFELGLQHMLSRLDLQQTYDVEFLSCCLNFVATYYTVLVSQPGYDAVSTLTHIERLSDTVVQPFLRSPPLHTALASLRRCSVLLFDSGPPRSEAPRSLPELGALLGAAAHDCPVTRQGSPVALVVATTRLVRVLGTLHKDLVQPMFRLLLEDDDVLLYLRQVCRRRKAPASAGNNHFGKFENLLQYELVQMARMRGAVDMQLYHQVSLELLIRLHEGDETIAHSLVSNIIFNQQFLIDVQTADMSMIYLEDRLKLSEPTSISSATQRPVTTSQRELFDDLQQHWSSMRGTYLSCLSASCNLNKSTQASLLTGRVGERLIPVDWIYLPLTQLFAASRRNPSDGDQVSAAAVAMVTDALRCVYVLEMWRERQLDAISAAVKMSRLMCTLLLGSDVFLDGGVQSYLTALLRLYCSRPCFLDKIDLKEAIVGVASFYDLYMQLVTQFEAESFGDAVFGSFVLFPLQQRHDIELRKTVWAEHPLLLRTMMMPVKQLVVPLSRFLEPEETDSELLRIYSRVLCSQQVCARWAPVLYLVAVHHVNRFCFTMTADEEDTRISILTQVLRSSYKEMQNDVVYYKRANVDQAHGFELYTELPAHRQQRVTLIRETVATPPS